MAKPLILIVLLFQSCTFKKLFIDKIDFYIYYKINSAFHNLDDDQKNKLKKDIKDFIENARLQIPKKLIPLLTDPTLYSNAQITTTYAKFVDLYLEQAGKFSHILSNLIGPLDSEQLKIFLKKQRDENKKLKEKINEKSTNQIEKTFISLLGHLTHEQQQLISKFEEHFKSRKIKRIERREKLLNEIQDIHKSTSSNENKNNLILSAFKKLQMESTSDSHMLELLHKITLLLEKNQLKNLAIKLKEFEEVVVYFSRVAPLK